MGLLYESVPYYIGGADHSDARAGESKLQLHILVGISVRLLDSVLGGYICGFVVYLEVL